jgi:hypothetical protein
MHVKTRVEDDYLELLRSIRLLFKTILSILFPNVFFSIILNSNEALSLPISNAGCVMVEREGFNKEAVRRLEKLITFNCCGIFSFISLQT